MGEPSRGRLLNSGGELIAEGMCWLDEPAGQATLEVERTPGVIQKQRGRLSLELESGRSLLVSDKPMIVLIAPPGGKPAAENRRRLYRLRLVDPMADIIEDQANSAEPESNAQDADAVDAAGHGRPTASILGRLPDQGETSAAR
jgi:hypothetical protein